jgi:hypothetical protein
VCVCVCVPVCVCVCDCLCRAKSIASSDASLEFWGVQSGQNTSVRIGLSAASRDSWEKVGEGPEKFRKGKEEVKAKKGRATAGGDRGGRRDTSSFTPFTPHSPAYTPKGPDPRRRIHQCTLDTDRGGRRDTSSSRSSADFSSPGREGSQRNHNRREAGAPRGGGGHKTQPPLQASESSDKRRGGGVAKVPNGEVGTRREGARIRVESSSSDDDSSPFASSPFLRRMPASFSQKPVRSS